MGGPDSDELINTPRPKKDIFDAVWWNDKDAIQFFVEEKGVLPNKTNSLNQTAAHIATSHRHCQESLDYLLDKDPALVSAKDKWGQTPLHLAIQKGYWEIVEDLVDKRNADIYQQIDGRFGNTAIHLAAEECRFQVMMYFVEKKKCDINVRNALGEPPIFSAASNNHLDMVQYLMSKGANATLLDKNDDNILFVCARRGDLKVPKYLLDEKKIAFDIDWRDNFGETILHRAVQFGQLDYIKYFVEKKNPDLDMFDNMDRTPLYVATERGNLDIVKYLVEKGADPKQNDLEGMIPAEIATDKRVKEYLLSLKRRRRNAPQPYVPLREDRMIFKWSAAGLLNTGSRERKSRQLANFVFFQVDNFLMLADVCFRYLMYKGYRYRERVQHESLFSPERIVERKFDPVAVDAIFAKSTFEK